MSQSTALALHAEAPKPTGVVALLDAAKHRIAPFLPEGVSVDRVAAAVYLASKDNPTLMQCEGETIVRAVARIQQWGLEIGVTAHLVPFGRTCTPIADYKGLAELMVRSGAVRHVTAKVVYAGDVFEHEHGLNPVLRHVPCGTAKERGAIVGAYCILRLPHGRDEFEFMPVEDIDAIRQKHSKQWKQGPVPAWYAKKTVVRQAAKLVPRNPRWAQTLATLDAVDEGEGMLMPADGPADEEFNYRTLNSVSPAGYEADDEPAAAHGFAAGYEAPTRLGATTPQLTPAAIAEAAAADPYDVGGAPVEEQEVLHWPEDAEPATPKATPSDLARRARANREHRQWLGAQLTTPGALTISQHQYISATLNDETKKDADLGPLVEKIQAAQAKAKAQASGAVVCPKCAGPVWDNRETKKKPNQPDYRCKDRDNCDGVIWPPREPKRQPDAIAADGEPEFADFTGDEELF